MESGGDGSRDAVVDDAGLLAGRRAGAGPVEVSSTSKHQVAGFRKAAWAATASWKYREVPGSTATRRITYAADLIPK